MRKKNCYKYFICFQFYGLSLGLFLRLKDSFSVSVDFCFYFLAYFPSLVCTIRDHLHSKISQLANIFAKQEKRCLCVPKSLLMPARKADLVLIPVTNVFFRVDHLYTFFVQWSPDVYGKDAKEQGFVVVEKEELNMIDNFFSEPTTKSWEVSTQEEAWPWWSLNYSILSKCSVQILRAWLARS